MYYIILYSNVYYNILHDSQPGCPDTTSVHEESEDESVLAIMANFRNKNKKEVRRALDTPCYVAHQRCGDTIGCNGHDDDDKTHFIDNCPLSTHFTYMEMETSNSNSKQNSCYTDSFCFIYFCTAFSYSTLNRPSVSHMPIIQAFMSILNYSINSGIAPKFCHQ